MTPFFSVIIPVYNVAPYLRTCLDSVVSAVERLYQEAPGLDQSVEIICIDDGSTDGSGALLDAYPESIAPSHAVTSVTEGSTASRRHAVTLSNGHLPFVILHQANAGVSVARNAGLDCARGDWVMFLDADDSWERDLLVCLYKKTTVFPSVDAMEFGGWHVDSEGRHLQALGCSMQEVLKGPAVLLDSRHDCRNSSTVTCDKIFRRSSIERISLRYAEGMRIGEDTLFMTLFLAQCGDFAFVGDVKGYRYLSRETSALRSARKARSFTDDRMRMFREIFPVWKRTHSKGLRLVLSSSAACLLGVVRMTTRLNGREVVGVDYLLDSREYNAKIIPFVVFHGTSREIRFFGLLYLLSPRFLRRRLLLTDGCLHKIRCLLTPSSWIKLAK